ncbi:hypothetical protein O1611_g1614 [Lasiodiplodia mahajangana]|uniref:Uncharacterized protein n=1 Tax=Lasiodiplodia mahajangana TaxID=1108764 RepID=A0ACC2JWW5_9PEZI|nr:hypothetical protein O1611_g1614 [Lasiodiplodia mahajangana]
MSLLRSFSTSAALLVKRLVGYSHEKLDPKWQHALETFKNNGARKKLKRDVRELLVLYREDGSSPVHTSSYNPQDTRPILSVKCMFHDGTLAPGVFHVLLNGKGMGFLNDKEE